MCYQFKEMCNFFFESFWFFHKKGIVKWFVFDNLLNVPKFLQTHPFFYSLLNIYEFSKVYKYLISFWKMIIILNHIKICYLSYNSLFCIINCNFVLYIMYITPYLFVMLMNLKMEVICLGLEHPLTSLFAHLSLDNYLCS
jgi:hypothetical protein